MHIYFLLTKVRAVACFIVLLTGMLFTATQEAAARDIEAFIQQAMNAGRQAVLSGDQSQIVGVYKQYFDKLEIAIRSYGRRKWPQLTGDQQNSHQRHVDRFITSVFPLMLKPFAHVRVTIRSHRQIAGGDYIVKGYAVLSKGRVNITWWIRCRRSCRFTNLIAKGVSLTDLIGRGPGTNVVSK